MILRAQADAGHHVPAALRRCAAGMSVLTSSGSSSVEPIFCRGFSEPYGFWNTICT